MTKALLPKLSIWQLFNLSLGFLGVQIGYSLQSSNTSRILSALGANVEHLSYFWLAAPIAGLLVQPIVGLSSDRVWTRIGRRIPFILIGAFISAIAMFFMPNSEHFVNIVPALVFGAFMLLFMDTAFNITMQPFRALVGDMVSDSQRNLGYSIQSFLINIGAVIGSLLPFLLDYVGVSNVPINGGKVAPTVIWAFYFGGACLLLSVLATAIFTKEYEPDKYAQYHGINIKQPKTSFTSLIKTMPNTMWKLGVVQFFSWFALFLMWVYTTSAIAQNVWGTTATDSTSLAFNNAGNWVGVIFAAYSFFAAVYALYMSKLATKFGRKKVYMGSLIMGGIGLLSIIFIHDKYLLLLSMLGVGIAWAAILAMPYAILSAVLPAEKLGVYMGMFNATITIPQITAGLLGGIILSLIAHNSAVVMIGIAGLSMLIAGISVLLLKE